MEERLAKAGAKVDDLIAATNEARQDVKLKVERLKAKREVTMKRGEEAADELKLALESAWDDVSLAWKEVQEGTERAARKFHSQ